ncbi:hypothetical protein K7432_015186 [Basidiobolus ranarum]|uniref:PROP1-like PPR domain-containing protein n=1 Tax=Basidiobolus ranarum TaxID=34480 RepID=A0ABR2VPG9_9FUNG
MLKPPILVVSFNVISKRARNLSTLSKSVHCFPKLRADLNLVYSTRFFQTTFNAHQEPQVPILGPGFEQNLIYKRFLDALHDKDVSGAVQLYQKLQGTADFSKMAHSGEIVSFFRLIQRETRQYPKLCAEVLGLIENNGINLETKAQKGEVLITYAKLGDYEGANRFAKTMLLAQEAPSVFIYNQLIAAAGKDNLSLALEQYDAIKKVGLRPDQFTYNMLFKFSKAHYDLDSLKRLHSEMTQYDISPNHITSSSLLDGYLKCSDIESATKVFDEMLSKGLLLEKFVFNSVISGCIRAGLLEKARSYKDKMLALQMTPEASTYRAYIKAHLHESYLDEAYESLNEMFVGHMIPDLNSVNSVLAICLRKSSPVMAMGIYRQMLRYQLQPNVSTYNYLFNILAKTPQNISKILKIYDDMQSSNVSPNIMTFNILIHAFAKMNRFDYVVAKHSELLLDGLQPDIFTYGSLIHAYSKHGAMGKATNLFDEMKRENIQPNTAIYNTLIDGHGKNSDLAKARELFEGMKRGVPATSQTYNILMNACLKNNDHEGVLKLYEEMLSQGLTPNGFVYTTLMKYYSINGQHDQVAKLWDVVRASEGPHANLTPNASILLLSFSNSMSDQGDLETLRSFWNSLKKQLSGRMTEGLYNTYVVLLCSIEKYDEAVAVVTKEMNQCGIQPQLGTFQALMKRINDSNKTEAKHILVNHMKHENLQLYKALLQKNHL